MSIKPRTLIQLGKGYVETHYENGIPLSGELYHHGILGQKWGIRRFQNQDGSLTAEGKIRYGKDGNGNADKRKSNSDPTDFRHITDKKEKARKEKEILKGWNSYDFDNYPKKEQERIIKLFTRVSEESGDYYEGKPITKEFEQQMKRLHNVKDSYNKVSGEFLKLKWKDDDYNDYKNHKYDFLYLDRPPKPLTGEERIRMEKLRKDEQKYKKMRDTEEDKLVGVVLRDIGYEDTPEARKLAYRLVFWD